MNAFKSVVVLVALILILSFTVFQFAVTAKSHVHITPDGEIIAHFHPTEDDGHEDDHNSHSKHSHTRLEYVAYSAFQKIESTKFDFVFSAYFLLVDNSIIRPETPKFQSLQIVSHLSLRGPPVV